MLALALARPHATVAVPKEQASIILVTDVSRSMLAEDVDPSRLEAARSAAQRFLAGGAGRGARGAVAFSTDPHTVEKPTDDHDEIESLIDGLSADGGTAAGDALEVALRMVDGPAEDRRRRRSCCSRTARPRPASTQSRSPARPPPGRADPHRGAGHARGHDHDPGRHAPAGAPRPETMRRIAELSAAAPSRWTTPASWPASTRTSARASRPRPRSARSRAAFAAGGLVLLLLAAALGVRATARLP